MAEVIIHVGMNMTGGAALQAALAAGRGRLEEAGTRYEADHDISGLTSDEQIAAADVVADRLDQTGLQRIVISNPAYLHRLDKLEPFFRRMEQRVTLRVFIWMRPVSFWVTVLGEHEPLLSTPDAVPRSARSQFGSQAGSWEALMNSYEQVLRWTARFGASVTILPLHEAGDIVADFGALTGIALAASAEYCQIQSLEDHGNILRLVSQAAGFDVTDSDAAPEVGTPSEMQARIARLRRRLADAERRSVAVAMQLQRLSQPQMRALRDRLRLSIALDEPHTLYTPATVTAEVARLRADAEEARAQMNRREAELMSSTSWRVTAPLRAASRLLRHVIS